MSKQKKWRKSCRLIDACYEIARVYRAEFFRLRKHAFARASVPQSRFQVTTNAFEGNRISTATATMTAIVALLSPFILNKDSATRISTLDTGTLSHEIAFVAPGRTVTSKTYLRKEREGTISSPIVLRRDKRDRSSRFRKFISHCSNGDVRYSLLRWVIVDVSLRRLLKSSIISTEQ